MSQDELNTENNNGSENPIIDTNIEQSTESSTPTPSETPNGDINSQYDEIDINQSQQTANGHIDEDEDSTSPTTPEIEVKHEESEAEPKNDKTKEDFENDITREGSQKVLESEEESRPEVPEKDVKSIEKDKVSSSPAPQSDANHSRSPQLIDNSGTPAADNERAEESEGNAAPEISIDERNTQSSIPTPLRLRVTSISSRQTAVPSHTRQTSTMSIGSNATVDNSHIFKKTFDIILLSKEAKKNETLKTAVQKAIDSLNETNSRNAHVLFDALKLTCQTSSNDLKSKAVDLFAKLFDYAQFANDEDKVKLTDDSVDVVAACFDGEGTDSEVELQVVRALMHSILLMPCHGASLLKAVRQIYNVFIFSLVPRNQSVAQGILTQVIGAIFQRITESLDSKSKSSSNVNLRASLIGISKDDLDDTNPTTIKLTLENLERLNDGNDIDRVNEANKATEKDEDLAVKDAFLIFRSMCKLSIKGLDSETIDMRSHSVRSKLLSLHIIHTILREHIEVFLNPNVVLLSSSNKPERLINTVRDYLSVAIARNAASPLAPMFELTLEIFWLITSNLRSEFKDEIPVFWNEIYFPVAEMKTSTPHQKRYLLSIIERLCNDSRCIIEFYLNYDCDSNMPNICEKIIDYLTKLSLARVDVTTSQKIAYGENKRKGISVYDISKIANLTTSTMSSRPPEPDVYNFFPLEYALKMTSISCSVAFLRSLYSWAQKGISTNNRLNSVSNGLHNVSSNGDRPGIESSSSTNHNSRNASFVGTNGGNTNTSANGGNGFGGITSENLTDTDDPEQFENLKNRKKLFLEGIRQFNQKPKRGIKFFLENHFIASDEPKDIAEFLLETDGLDKATIGEYLGEGDEKNISIMHAFVDQMDFTSNDFVDSMRLFLQSFRLPGEAQKIDRFMLKFAERYVLGNPSIFSNADAAYVLAYSVILLNTDLHSPQIKNRMTVDNFIMNNSGIDDGKDLPSELLTHIYEKIQSDEIKLQSEQHAALLAGDLNMSSTNSPGFFGGRDLNREAYIHASKEMSTKTEKLVKNLGKKFKSEENNSVTTFYAASHVHHVKSIFDTLWMSILAGLTPPFKEFDEEDVLKICLEGIKLSIKIACMFDLDYARTSFIGALVQFENLHNYEEMKPKNVDAIYIMLDIAVSEGNNLKKSWIQILTSISQLERLQLIAQGVDQDSIPDVSVARLVNRNSIESVSSPTSYSASFFLSFTSQTSASQNAANKFHNQHLTTQAAHLLTQTTLEVAIDKVFTNSSNLLGDNIVDFVKALSEVSSEEIESSGQSSNPRMFSLQKVVDICYYNMNRIRLEWSQLWSIMGETFNKVGCHSNLAIVFFALDSLRQLSMRFLDIDELSHFKFQKEFLKPFEYIISNNDSIEVKDMVLECINNMILARASQIKSGWKTIFGVLIAGAKESRESLVSKTFKMASWINREYAGEVTRQESFADLVVCFTEIAKNEKFQRLSLLSLEVLQKLIKQIANLSFGDGSKMDISNKDEKNEKNDNLVRLWFPVLFGFHDIIMTGEELEVRSRALTHLFDSILEYGDFFEPDFWDLICRQLLFPIFSVLSNHWELNNIEDRGDISAPGSPISNYSNGNNDVDRLSVWLSTTLIQALRNMITLFTHYSDSLSRMLEEYLDLIISCICQENDTIARIGRSCLYTLLIDNGSKFDDEQWRLVTKAFQNLFDLTTAKELFTSDPLKQSNYIEEDENNDVGSIIDLQDPSTPKLKHLSIVDDTEARLRKSKEKSLIVVKCVLQLLMIETLSELFENEIFYESIPYKHLVKLANLLNDSFHFARKFNDDYDLRVRLWNAGVIERLPNLLKQESSSLAVFLNIMFRMYCDDDKTNTKIKKEIMKSIMPLCTTITERYSELDETNQQKNISTWKPVIVEIYQGYVELDDEDFIEYSSIIYDLTLKLFSKSMSPDLRLAVKTYLARVGDTFINDKQ